MIAYRVEIRCNGCGVAFGPGTPYADPGELPKAAEQLEEVAVVGAKWVLDRGGAHFCPTCQRIRRRAGELAPGVVLMIDERNEG